MLEINDVRLFVGQSGRGDPLVLVHGSWDDHQVWAPVTDHLARQFRVVRTLPGAGHEPHATHPALYESTISEFAGAGEHPLRRDAP